MKKTNLCLAILVATSLTACGSSSGGKKDLNQQAADQKAQAEQVKAAKEKAAKDKLAAEEKAKADKAAGDQAAKEKGDATDNPYLDYFKQENFSEKESVGSYQYVKNAGSSYDMANNPNRLTAAASVSVRSTLNVDNPDLTNAILAQEVDPNKTPEEGNVKIRYVGWHPTQGGDNLQVENMKNVDLSAGESNDAKNNGLFSVETVNGAAGIDQTKGLEKLQTTTTRIFGHKHLTADGSETANSFSGVNNTGTTLVPVEDKLLHVQYGRISANLDPVSSPNKDIPAAYLPLNDSKAVHNYFYRGTNETLIDEMSALPKDQIFKYQGHALTYGLKHAKNSEQAGRPNSFGVVKDYTVLGSFVEAEFNVGKKSIDGKIYDVWLEKGNDVSTAEKNTLIEFENTNVEGNSFFGDAKNNKGDMGVVRGSFFGDAATEMGGAVNSVAKGHSNDAWGASFGAKRTVQTAPPAPVITQPATPIENTQAVEDPSTTSSSYNF